MYDKLNVFKIQPALLFLWDLTNWPLKAIKNTFEKKKDFYLFIFREKGRQGENEGQKHTPPSGDLAHNPGTCPDWKSNQWPFGSQASTQSTEPTSQVYNHEFLKILSMFIFL